MDNLINRSSYKILNYKYDLQKLYNIIFKFCIKHNIIISNHNYIMSLIKKYKFKLIDINNDFNFKLFSHEPKKDAINLVNEIYSNYSKYCFMSSYILDKEITISIDNIKLIDINLLFETKNKILNNIKYLEFNNNLYLPDYIELFHISHKLYHPTYFLKYIKFNNNDYNTLEKLNDIPIDGYNLNYIYKKIIYNIINKTDYKNPNLTKYIDKKNIKNIITNKLFNILLNTNLNINLILIDINAIDILNNDHSNIHNLYFILNNTKTNLNLIVDIIKKIINDNKLLINFEILIKSSSFYIYNDFRLKKYMIKVQDNDNDKIYNIITFFNSTDYELIPIIKEYKCVKIPHPIVIVRFLLLNLISLQLFDKNYNDNIYSNFIYYLSLIQKIKYNFTNIFYDGIYIDDKIDKFKFGAFIYRPWQYFIKNEKLLTIQ